MWAGSSKWSKDNEPMGEINVTPLVDVMLVLLIIFMVTAPLLTQGVNVDLPDADSPPMQQNIEPLVISIRANGKIFYAKTMPFNSSSWRRALRLCVNRNPIFRYSSAAMPRPRMNTSPGL